MTGKRTVLTASIPGKSPNVHIKSYLASLGKGEEQSGLIKAVSAFYLPQSLVKEGVRNEDIMAPTITSVLIMLNQIVTIREALQQAGIATDLLDTVMMQQINRLSKEFGNREGGDRDMPIDKAPKINPGGIDFEMDFS
jgi:hypothetical protein